MSDDGEEAGQRREDINGVWTELRQVIRMTAGEKEDVKNSDVTLERVKQKRRDGKPLGSRACNVGSADIAATSLADVFATKDADEQVSERNRAEQIGNDRYDEHAVIQSSSAKDDNHEQLAQQI